MPGRLLWIAVVAAALAALVAGRAHAQCSCKDVPACGNAIACNGKVPGNACSPPKNGTCKGLMYDPMDSTACCCGCSPGDFPVGCDFDMLTIDPISIPTCGSVPLSKVSRKRLARVDALLKKAASKCRKGKPSAATVKAVLKALTQLEDKAKALDAQGKIPQLRTDGGRAARAGSTCATAYEEAIEEIKTRIEQEAQTATAPTTTTTTASTTTTTLPMGNFGCSGQASVAGTDSIVYYIYCAQGGPFDAMGVLVPQHDITSTKIQPSGFTCHATTWTPGGAVDFEECDGSFTSGGTHSGPEIVIAPPPLPGVGLGLVLYVRIGTQWYGPYPLPGV